MKYAVSRMKMPHVRDCAIVVISTNLKRHVHLAKLIPQRFLKPAVCKYPTTVNNSEIYIVLSKPCPWMRHLMCGNRVRNGSDRKPQTGKTRSLKLALFKNRIGVALLYYHADMHVFIESAQRTPTREAVSATPSLNAVVIIRVIIDSTALCIVLHTVHRKFQKCNFWWTHSACLGPSIAAIFHTISAHKVLH